MNQIADGKGVCILLGRHIDNLSIDQLHALIGKTTELGGTQKIFHRPTMWSRGRGNLVLGNSHG